MKLHACWCSSRIDAVDDGLGLSLGAMDPDLVFASRLLMFRPLNRKLQVINFRQSLMTLRLLH